MQLLELCQLFYNQSEKLNSFGIQDPNLLINANELIKIFTRKTILNMKTIIENILKKEREYKALQSEDDSDGDLLITNGPGDLFRILSTTYDMVKKYKIKDLHKEIFRMFKECLLLYMIGVDLVISRIDLCIDNEFLIAVCNNTIKFSILLSNFIEDVKEPSFSCLGENEIEEFIGQKELLKSVNFLSETSISRLVYELSSGIQDSFKEKSFYDISIEKVIENVNDIYSTFTKFMHFSTQKKYWSEILHSLVLSYIRYLLLSSKGNSKKTIEDLRLKLQLDKNLFIEHFSMIGSNQLKEVTKLLDLVNDFLSSDINMLSFSCANLKNKLETAFTFSTAKALIKLRSDWSSDVKNEANDLCKEFLETWEIKNADKIKKQSNDVFLNQLNEDLLKEENLAKSEEDKNKKEELELEGINEPLRKITINLEDFLYDDEVEDKAQISFMKSRTINQGYSTNNAPIVIDDIIKEGRMLKKSNKTSKWQERFFQIKNNGLYWYNNEDSSQASNFIPFNQITKVPYMHKPCKFTLLYDKSKRNYYFACKDDSECYEWIDAIKSEMFKTSKKTEEFQQLTLRKKIISAEALNLPHVFSHKSSIREKIVDSMNTEKFFNLKNQNKNYIKKLTPNNQIVEQKNDKKKHSIINSNLIKNHEPMFYNKMNTIRPLNEDFESSNIFYNRSSEREGSCCGVFWSKIKKLFQ